MQINTKTKSIRLTKREHQTSTDAAGILRDIGRFAGDDVEAGAFEQTADFITARAEQFAPQVREKSTA